ncbi:unnamed protein product [Menidia menidia]|uniref:(Atlantic silverside) hypothetical protein n=1 Tax=Menidia menidia TaxID=238744 RepID=A0A8S4AT09_9TELE|nr:unnamed protein product [Menidia menidia]
MLVENHGTRCLDTTLETAVWAEEEKKSDLLICCFRRHINIAVASLAPIEADWPPHLLAVMRPGAYKDSLKRLGGSI